MQQLVVYFTHLKRYLHRDHDAPCLSPKILNCHRVLKCDVIKMKFLKLSLGICQDILKEQCPRGLLAKNEHLGANCL